MSLFACILCITQSIPVFQTNGFALVFVGLVLRCEMWLRFASVAVVLSGFQHEARTASRSLRICVFEMAFCCFCDFKLLLCASGVHFDIAGSNGFNTTLLVSFLTQRPKSILDSEACSAAWVKPPIASPPEYPSEWRATPLPRSEEPFSHDLRQL